VTPPLAARSTDETRDKEAMSAWRRRIIDQFPEIAGERDTLQGLYLVFGWLLRRAIDAHRAEDRSSLVKIYDFAAWCARSSNQELWNPAGVSFYEHLPDHALTRAGIVDWVPPDVFRNVANLLEAKMNAAEFASLVQAYDRRHGTALGQPRKR